MSAGLIKHLRKKTDEDSNTKILGGVSESMLR